MFQIGLPFIKTSLKILRNVATAIEHYEKFLELWKDADPGISEFEDVKKRRVGLKRQSSVLFLSVV